MHLNDAQAKMAYPVSSHQQYFGQSPSQYYAPYQGAAVQAYTYAQSHNIPMYGAESNTGRREQQRNSHYNTPEYYQIQQQNQQRRSHF